MGHGMKALVAVGMLGVSSAQAVQFTNGSFEQGTLNGWEAVGDVSIQTSAIGGSPTHGDYQVLISTLGGDGRETPYSGDPAVHSCGNVPYFQSVTYGSDWPGINSPWALCATSTYSISSVQQNIGLRAGDVVSFDYNFFSLERSYVDQAWVYAALADDLDNPYNRVNYLSGGYTFPGINPSLGSSGIDLCSQYDCNSYFNTTTETGWQTYRWLAPQDGVYAFIVGINDHDDTFVPSAMLLDNFRIRVPEPSSLGLLGLGLAGLGLNRRRKAA